MSSTNQTEFHLTPELQGQFATEFLSNLSEPQLAIEKYPSVKAPASSANTTETVEEANYVGQIVPLADSSNSLPQSLRDNWTSLALSGLSRQSLIRITHLAQKADGWRGPGSKKLSAPALRDFLHFWKVISDQAAEPFITLAPNGNLYAEWHASWKRHLDLEFAGHGKVYFGVFDGDYVSEGKARASDIAAEMLARPRNPFSWQRA